MSFSASLLLTRGVVEMKPFLRQECGFGRLKVQCCLAGLSGLDVHDLVGKPLLVSAGDHVVAPADLKTHLPVFTALPPGDGS